MTTNGSPANGQRVRWGLRTPSSSSSDSESYENGGLKLNKPSSDDQNSNILQLDVHEKDTDIHKAIPDLIGQDSLPLKFNKTDTEGRYIITADDPAIRDILKLALTQQQRNVDSTSSTPSKRHVYRDIIFTRQFTQFDRLNPSNNESPFFGFFVLFWIGMVLMLVRVGTQNYRQYGSVLGTNEVLQIMFSKDIILLGLTDGVMCVSTVVGVLLQKLVLRGWINWNRTGWIIQNLWQTFYLGAILGFAFYRDWPWTHTVFTVLHTLVFVMKQHSYAFYNGYLSEVYKRKKILEVTLAELKSRTPSRSPVSSPKASAMLDFDPFDTQEGLRARRRPLNRRTSSLANEKSQVASVANSIKNHEPLDSNQMKAFAQVISKEIEFCESELKGKCSLTKNYYPSNLNLKNFAQWTCFPTLVYELEYPREEDRDWWYILEKSAATFGVLCLMQVISQSFIYPAVVETVRMKERGMTLSQRWENFPYIVSDMLFPLLLEQLLTWYVIWECVLNVLAELTYFADRGFYAAWWNSTSWDQYARDWNRPVHNFLLRHVYHSSISAFHLSKKEAMFATFLLSALVHELIMFCLFQKVRGYLFCMQLLQLPLAAFSKTKLMKGRKVLGNVIFWIGLFIGPSFLTSLYLII